jgi:hypothetical protein
MGRERCATGRHKFIMPPNVCWLSWVMVEKGSGGDGRAAHLALNRVVPMLKTLAASASLSSATVASALLFISYVRAWRDGGRGASSSVPVFVCQSDNKVRSQSGNGGSWRAHLDSREMVALFRLARGRRLGLFGEVAFWMRRVFGVERRVKAGVGLGGRHRRFRVQDAVRDLREAKGDAASRATSAW